MKKQFLLTAVLLFVCTAIFAQGDFRLSEQMFSRINQNPSAVGNNDKIQIFTATRLQYVGMGLEQSPTSALLNAHYYNESLKSGFGLSFTYDELGLQNQTINAKVCYAYNLDIFENGLMKIEVVSVEEDGVTGKIIAGGVLGNKKSLNVPGVTLDIPFISEADREDMIYACLHDGDFIALSFVNCRDDVLQAREIFKQYGREDLKVISKIESTAGFDNLDEILEVSDGVMVARGDLGVEVPLQRLPIYQKSIIKRCREYGKICIVATEMLESMKKNVRPTRAEVSDIANAVLDGTDAVMLSGETTTGKYPSEAVGYMASICENLSLREREADKAERETYELTQMQYVLDNIEDYEGPVPAVIQHMNRSGIWVKINHKIKAMIELDDVYNEGYDYKYKSRTYVNPKLQDTLHLGDTIYVLDPEVSLEMRSVLYHRFGRTEEDIFDLDEVKTYQKRRNQ